MKLFCNLCNKACSSLVNLKQHTVLCITYKSKQKHKKKIDKTEKIENVQQNEVFDANTEQDTCLEQFVKKEEPSTNNEINLESEDHVSPRKKMDHCTNFSNEDLLTDSQKTEFKDVKLENHEVKHLKRNLRLHIESLHTNVSTVEC